MLKFAAVGNQSRRPKVQGATGIPRCDSSLELCASRTRIALCAIAAVMWVAPLLTQASLEFDDLLPELAAKIAAVVAADSQVSLIASEQDSTSGAARPLQERVAALLASRGVRLVDAGDAVTAVGLSCSENLRERSCLAEVRTNTRRDVVMVTRRHEGTTPVGSRLAMSLELRPLFVRHTPILDVAVLDGQFLVLDPASIALYQETAQGWQPVRARPLPVTRVWPRDVRGRLSVEADRFSAFLPGVACSGRVNDLTANCADGRHTWPLGIENSGLDPARNYFDTPEGFSFYSAASLGADADARWLVADRNGALSLLDGARRPLARVATADDVAGIAAACGAESYVVAAGLSDGRDAVRLFQVARQRLIPIGSPVFLPGKLTVLWAAPGATTATAVAHDIGSGRYEAFLATISCGR